MMYIHALELIDLAIKKDLVTVKDNKVAVYRNGAGDREEGWYLEEKESVAQELMKDEKGQEILFNALKEKGVEFNPTDYSWLNTPS